MLNAAALLAAIAVSQAAPPPADPSADPPTAKAKQAVIVAVGVAGDAEYGEMFSRWSGRWRAAARKAGADFTLVGQGALIPPSEDRSMKDRDRLRAAIQRAGAIESTEPIWLVLIGHGTFDGRAAKFNLRGPDVAAKELNKWLDQAARPVAVINCASASGSFINRLSTANRVVVTSTKSGYQHNFARFGEYLSKAVHDGAVDLDKDGQTSLLEAFLAAAKQTQEFYKEDGRLATEHALIDDNGDKLGTPAAFFRGIRPTKAAKNNAALDGLRASQFLLIRSEQERRLAPELRKKRDLLERGVADLRAAKSSFDQDEYYERLESLLLQLSEILVSEESR